MAGELDITPSFVTLEESKSVTLTVSGGRAPYSYLDISGDGILTPLNGHAEYTAPALGADDSRLILITDSKGNQVEAEILVTVAPVPLLQVNPTVSSISTAGSATFTPSGGKTPYAYSVISGAGSVDPATGPSTTYTPSAVTTAVVRVTDSSGQIADATVYVSAGPPPLVIDPPTLQIVTGGGFTFTATGGSPPYTFSATDGSIVPATGAYTAPGSPNPSVTVTVTDSVAAAAAAAVTVIAPPAGDPLAIVPRALTIGKFKSFQFSAVDGSPPYQYFIVAGNGSITLDGLYTASNKVGTETVKVRDSNGAEDFATITVKAK
ncbi:MAG TPA: hypothetical protein P5117_04860 [Spirochaetia bacterium]|nr:hypothetical protein [Spirochaetales bacterium]HRY80511.1 hypothetical protein [Spirochaetia bacterium]HRZ88798.1 hypothetical protein [Spirochaetia bacterium]